VKSPEHVRGAGIRLATRLLENGEDVVIKETFDGLFVGSPHKPVGVYLRPAADLPDTHVDIYSIAGVRLMTPVLTHRGRYLPQEIL
jgi:hypothetical protein